MNSRQQLIRELRRNLESTENPRLFMALLIAITGMTGFIASVILLHFGLHTLWLRYLIAGSIAYLVFLAMLYQWTHWRSADGLDLSGFIPSTSPGQDAAPAGEALGQIHDGGHLPLAAGAGPLYLLFILLALIASCAWVITSAPELMAEMLLDSAVVAGVYRRLRHRDRRSWIGTALRGTARPFLVVLLVLMAVGWIAQKSHPEAVTLGEVLHAKR